MGELKLKDNSFHKIPRQDGDSKEDTGKLDYENLDKKIKDSDITYLHKLSEELNSQLQNKDFLKKNLYLFGEDYEHNTDDGLFAVRGWDKDSLTIETGNLVGYVSTDKLKINISSRFGDDFLIYLLCYAEGMLEVPDKGTLANNGLIDWVIVFLWKMALKKAYRLGIPKLYVRQQEKRHSVKGNINILDYSIYKGIDGRYLCDFYQYDYDNPVTRLIAYTFTKIDGKLLKDSLKLKNTFETCVGGKKATLSAYLNTPYITNPYYFEYNKVISLSKNILRKKIGGITDSSSISSAFLFDMSMLFEYYIRKVLKNGELNLLPKNDKSMTISRGLGKNDDRHLYPDIIIDKGNNSIEIYDVKYKHFDNEYGVKREDLFQLHTYVLHLSTKYKIKKCGFIYPKFDKGKTDKVNDKENIIKHPSYENGIPFRVVFLNIPQVALDEGKTANSLKDSYEKIMKEREKDFVNRIS